MIFASTPPINDDPEPYDNVTPQEGETWVLAPRPEFDRLRAHGANPILVAMRGVQDLMSFTMMLDSLDNSGYWECWHPQTQIDHARRVLTRLAGLTEGLEL